MARHVGQKIFSEIFSVNNMNRVALVLELGWLEMLFHNETVNVHLFGFDMMMMTFKAINCFDTTRESSAKGET